jgi:hypothetical protein
MIQRFMCHRKAWNLLNIDVITYNFAVEIENLFYFSKIVVLQESCKIWVENVIYIVVWFPFPTIPFAQYRSRSTNIIWTNFTSFQNFNNV